MCGIGEEEEGEGQELDDDYGIFLTDSEDEKKPEEIKPEEVKESKREEKGEGDEPRRRRMGW